VCDNKQTSSGSYTAEVDVIKEQQLKRKLKQLPYILTCNAPHSGYLP